MRLYSHFVKSSLFSGYCQPNLQVSAGIASGCANATKRRHISPIGVWESVMVFRKSIKSTNLSLCSLFGCVFFALISVNVHAAGTGGECVVDRVEPIILNPGIIFETDFSQDTGYSVQSVNQRNKGPLGPVDPPTGWDRVGASHNGRVSVVSGAGIDGGNALKLEWDPETEQPTVALDKHLTSDDNTGFEELYIRYNIKLPNNFRASDASEYRPYWKWGRLWQNTHAIPDDQTWTEQRPDSGFIVWGMGGNGTYTQLTSVWSENSGPNLEASRASGGGEHQITDHFLSGAVLKERNGYFENIANGAWELDPAN